MNLEYDYKVCERGIVFSLPPDRERDPRITETGEQALKIERFIMMCWEEAINKTFPDPHEVARLMTSPEGQAVIAERATVYLSKLLADFPPELDRRRGKDRRATGRDKPDRRQVGR